MRCGPLWCSSAAKLPLDSLPQRLLAETMTVQTPAARRQRARLAAVLHQRLAAVLQQRRQCLLIAVEILGDVFDFEIGGALLLEYLHYIIINGI